MNFNVKKSIQIGSVIEVTSIFLISHEVVSYIRNHCIFYNRGILVISHDTALASQTNGIVAQDTKI
jgi:hypothetical protein